MDLTDYRQSFECYDSFCMQTKIEGILLSKTPYQDRHLIGHLLLRNGKKISVLFYGGQGGGKKQKGSTLELGYMMSLEMGHSKSTSELYRAKEWQPIWFYEKIRQNHLAYYGLCFFLEVMEKLSMKDDLHDEHRDFNHHDEGLFRAASNAIFHLEQSLINDNFNILGELFTFLGKTLIEQGVFPVRDHCVFCDTELKNEDRVFLVPDHGGFSCRSCVNEGEMKGISDSHMGRDIWELLGVVANHKYSDIVGLVPQSSNVVKTLLDYFCYQFHMNRRDFKSLPMLL